MNRPELYHKTVDTLLDAYNNNTLQHADCTACAVGNICHQASIETGVPNSAWSTLFITNFGTQHQPDWIYRNQYYTAFNLKNGIVDVYRLIEATGYTIEELALIERVFEGTRAPINNSYSSYEGYLEVKKRAQFTGLTAVLKALEEIHQVNQETHNESQTRLETIAKTKFEFAEL